MNIMNEAVRRLNDNGIVQKEMTDKYKKDLEKTRREEGIMLHR